MELLIIYSTINVRNPVSVSTDASYLDRSLNIERISMGLDIGELQSLQQLRQLLELLCRMRICLKQL